MMKLDEFKTIPPGAVFRVVTTKYHNVVAGNPELTFVCKKGDAAEQHDWTIYCHFADKGVAFISQNGDKVTSREQVLSIFPCDKEVLSLYRD